MINELEIHNFKSIKDLTLPCKRFNIFIGEPNTGKSNILEALGLLSFIAVRQYYPEATLDGFVRYERTANLFFDGAIEEGLTIRCDGAQLNLEWQDGHLQGSYAGPHGPIAEVHGDAQTITEVTNYKGVSSPSVQFYRRPEVENFIETGYPSLLPPYGANLPSLLLRKKRLRHDANLAFVAQGLRLAFPGLGNRIELLKNYDDAISSYPYKLASESQQRQVFYTTAIDANRYATLLFEEPEAHSFLGDVHFLAEVIALDQNMNQYFVTTHSDCFLMSHICKASRNDLAVHIVYEKDHQTRVRTLSEEEMPELFELNIFLNWEAFVHPE